MLAAAEDLGQEVGHHGVIRSKMNGDRAEAEQLADVLHPAFEVLGARGDTGIVDVKPPKGSSTTPLGWLESNGGGFQRLRKSSTPSTNRSPNSIPGTCADRSNADVRGRSRADR